ncbi:3-ketoacyl-CoA synthase 11 [Pleodorina starrii]|uniref:3-ketoacyl-CoA synthase n=1 Tax=Pleodorina starrii TaxID=330485 RepID=A0A9W6F1J3_9CHLO|nr:3-ketoacyl-CoA synthase 11 [Pleodorina starrii]GLC52844.1 3-ketoacyl-CoA synthase 11 [Pleodorina starrii]GLC65812.1 3-ketoacyl-CoA synthase 11 [Pleodorina starrii]
MASAAKSLISTLLDTATSVLPSPMALLPGKPRTPVYLVDFACYKPPAEYRVVATEVEAAGRDWNMYSEEMKEFLWKVLLKSGLSAETTYLPPAVHPCHVAQPQTDIPAALAEARQVLTGAADELFQRTGVSPRDIDIVITSNSIFCPTPSLASMIVNHYKMRSDVQSYHLGGMGCANGTIGINLVRDMLQAHPNANLLFLCSEVVSYCAYPGKDKARMVANAIFRMGATAVLLSNKASAGRVAKYQLETAIRMHAGASDRAYKSMHWSPDSEGINGIFLSKDIVDEAGKVIEDVLKAVTPKIMTWGQYGEAGAHLVRSRLLGQKLPPYRPDYTKCVDHFLVHAGGYAVLKGLQEGLDLPASSMIPSFAALREYGNTSSSTTWYALGYTEACEGVKRGERVFQLGVGGGMKGGCNVWRALRDVDGSGHTAWAHFAGRRLREADLPRGIDKDEVRHPRAVELLARAGPAREDEKDVVMEH